MRTATVEFPTRDSEARFKSVLGRVGVMAGRFSRAEVVDFGRGNGVRIAEYVRVLDARRDARLVE